MQLLIDESFAEKVIPADDSVRLLDRIVEEMDLSKLERAYDVRGRKSATEPSIMFKHKISKIYGYSLQLNLLMNSRVISHPVY